MTQKSISMSYMNRQIKDQTVFLAKLLDLHCCIINSSMTLKSRSRSSMNMQFRDLSQMHEHDDECYKYQSPSCISCKDIGPALFYYKQPYDLQIQVKVIYEYANQRSLLGLNIKALAVFPVKILDQHYFTINSQVTLKTRSTTTTTDPFHRLTLRCM